MASRGRKSAPGKPPRRRLRYGPLPVPAETIEAPYGRGREPLAGLSCGQLTQVVADSDAFKEEIATVCQKLDAARQGRRGPAPAYTALECELVLLYQRVCGLRSYKEARDRLAGDRARDARQLFGLDRARQLHGQRKLTLTAGIPSEATISRHRKRFGERRRRGAYERLARRLVREHLIEFPEMRQEARLTGIDGSKIATHYTCPKYDRDGKLVNAKKVTCRDGGFVPWHAVEEKSGNGYNLVTQHTMSGLPLSWGIGRLHESEAELGRQVVDGDYRRNVQPHLESDAVHVIVGDAAYHSHSFRLTARQVGLVEQAHYVSHAKIERARKSEAKANKVSFAIEGYPNWMVNGHYELRCKCGHSQLSKALSVSGGKATVRTEGRCKNCGSISITSGRWRKAQNPQRFVRCLPADRDQTDWAFGNPLTFHDQIATIYGHKRFGHGEGLHGALVTRFGLLKGKRWFRRIDQARTDVAVVYSVMHALAIEQRRRAAAGAASAASDPPTAQAA